MSRFLRERKATIIFVGLMFVQLILLSLQIPLGQEANLFERTSFAVLAPLQRGVQGLLRFGGDIWNRYVVLRRVEDQNRRLRDELFHLRQENGLLRRGLDRLANRQEAETFLRALGRAFCLAEVIGLDAANPFKSIVINRGTKDGLRSQMAVVDARGRLVGRLIEPIGIGEATVQLVTDENNAVSVAGADHPTAGLLVGNSGDGRGWLKNIPASDETLVENEPLLTTGFDRVYPRGLPAGTIVSIRTDGSLFKKIAVLPAFEIRDLVLVAVLTGDASGRGDVR
jgi:rod shape-determining protein MreC